METLEDTLMAMRAARESVTNPTSCATPTLTRDPELSPLTDLSSNGSLSSPSTEPTDLSSPRSKLIQAVSDAASRWSAIGHACANCGEISEATVLKKRRHRARRALRDIDQMRMLAVMMSRITRHINRVADRIVALHTE